MTPRNSSRQAAVPLAVLAVLITDSCRGITTQDRRLEPPDPRVVQGVCVEDRGEGTRLGTSLTEWITGGVELGSDEVGKRRARAAIREHLSSPDHDELHTAVIALRYVPEAIPDPVEARRVLLPLLEAREPSLRVLALSVLRSWWQPGDGRLAIHVAGEMKGTDRSHMVSLLSYYHRLDLTGEPGALALEILREATGENLGSALSGLGRARISPEIEAFLLSESRGPDPQRSRFFVAHGLSLLRHKSAPVVERLLEDVRDHRDEESLWSCGGLSYGVTPDLRSTVCDAVLELLPTCTERDWETRTKYLMVLENYGRERHAVAIETLATMCAHSSYIRSRYLDVARIMRWRESQPMTQDGF